MAESGFCGKESMQKIIKFGKIIVFTVGLWIFLVVVTILCRPKWYREGIWEPVTEIHDGFYALDRNSIDVAFVGSSQIFANINPLLIWKEYGISSYDMTSSSQRIWISRYYVQEILKYQSPKVIVLEVMKFFEEAPNDEDRNRKALDYMRFSKEKVEAIRESIRDCPDETMISYIFPIIRFHQRWKNLVPDDFTYITSDKKTYMYGYAPRYGIEEQTLGLFLPSVPDSGIISGRNRKMIRDIADICRQSGTDLVLIRTPQKDWTFEQHCKVESLASELGIDFIDYNLLIADIRLEARDFDDVNHLNANGADKVSAYIGKYLTEKYSFDHHNDSKQWEQDYKKYREYDEKRCSDAGFLHKNGV